MKKILFFTFFLCFIYGCWTKSENDFTKIVNNNFINFTDTVAYKSGTFFLIPNDTAVIDPTRKLIVMVDTIIGDSRILSNSLLAELKTLKLNEFENLMTNQEIQAPLTINLSEITKTGKYSLIAATVGENMANRSLVGQISFPKHYLGHDKAIIFFSVQSSPKAGLSSAFLLEKKNDNWLIKKKIELERW